MESYAEALKRMAQMLDADFNANLSEVCIGLRSILSGLTREDNDATNQKRTTGRPST